MPSKQLLATWAVFDFGLLAAGVTSIVLSIVWGQPSIMMNMILSKNDLLGGLILGIAYLLTFVVSVVAIVQRNHIIRPLVMLNWMLILDTLATLVIGTAIWFFTLQERKNFHGRFALQSRESKIFIQDKLKCCGYFNASDLVEIGGSFCANETFVKTTNNATKNFCVGPITTEADFYLNNMFTTIYGFMAIVLGLFLASLCVIKKRQEAERFKKIDAKRGGRGFV